MVSLRVTPFFCLVALPQAGEGYRTEEGGDYLHAQTALVLCGGLLSAFLFIFFGVFLGGGSRSIFSAAVAQFKTTEPVLGVLQPATEACANLRTLFRRRHCSRSFLRCWRVACSQKFRSFFGQRGLQSAFRAIATLLFFGKSA